MANPSAQSIQTLSEFLLHAGTNFQLFDLGRGVHAMDTQMFLDLENGMLPCPRPRQQHAWFAIVFWSGKPVKQHYVWFVKFPNPPARMICVINMGVIMSRDPNFQQCIKDQSRPLRHHC